MKWKPLSKAPKDGRLMLGWFPNGKRGPYWEKIFWGKPYDDKAFNTDESWCLDFMGGIRLEKEKLPSHFIDVTPPKESKETKHEPI